MWLKSVAAPQAKNHCTMIEANVHLAYAPRGPGLLYAVLWFAHGRHVFGWYIGSHDGLDEASYFMMADYFTDKPDVLFRSVQDDLDGPWVESGPLGERPLGPSPIPQELHHELARLQDQFVRHWLFFEGEPGSEDDARELNARELSVRHVNIKPSRLGKLRTAPAVWRYDAPAADINVLQHLSKLWPLDERLGS